MHKQPHKRAFYTLAGCIAALALCVAGGGPLAEFGCPTDLLGGGMGFFSDLL